MGRPRKMVSLQSSTPLQCLTLEVHYCPSLTASAQDVARLAIYCSIYRLLFKDVPVSLPKPSNYKCDFVDSNKFLQVEMTSYAYIV